MSNLLVGAAKVSINPTPDMYPIPNRMTDFGLEPMSQQASYDEMFCRAIAIETPKAKLLLLTFELAGAPDFPHYPQDIAKATGVHDDLIFIMGTHNHSAPRYRTPETENRELADWIARYEKLVYEAGITACKQAVSEMRPARYGYGESVSDINVNRNLLSFGNYWVEARNPNGFCDKTLSIIKFVDDEGKLIAALLNHPTHATNIYMLKDADHKAKTSGNFTGIACRFVEERFGNNAVAMWTSGAAGNLNPVMSHGLQYEYPDGYTTQVQYPDGTGYMQMEYIGRTHGVDCCKGLYAITRYTDCMPVAHIVGKVDLPTQECVEPWPPKSFSDIRNGGNGVRDYKEVAYGQLPPPGRIPEMVPGKPKALYLHLLELGDIAILFANAELFAQIGRDMKEVSPLKHTVIITHHYGPKCHYIFDKTSEDVLLPMAYGGVKPGSADELIVEQEAKLFDSILDQK